MSEPKPTDEPTPNPDEFQPLHREIKGFLRENQDCKTKKMFASIKSFLRESRLGINQSISNSMSSEEAIVKAQYARQFCVSNLEPGLIEKTDRLELVGKTPRKLESWKEMVGAGARSDVTDLEKAARIISTLTLDDLAAAARSEKKSLLSKSCLHELNSIAYQTLMNTAGYWIRVEEVTREMISRENN